VTLKVYSVSKIENVSKNLVLSNELIEVELPP